MYKTRVHKKRKGIILISSLLIIVFLAILSSSITSQSISEVTLSKKNKKSMQAFWLAEAGLNHALSTLQDNFSVSSISPTTLGPGQYQVTITDVSSTEKTITATACIPSVTDCSTEYILEANIKKEIPANFFDHAIYSAGDVDFNGSSYSLTNSEPSPDNKALIYSGENGIEDPTNIDGSIIYDETITPLALVSFEELKAESESQGNFYDQDRIDNMKKTGDSFLSDFWHGDDDGVDNDGDGIVDEEDEWTPNIVYVTTDLQINGDIGTIGGLVVVAGNVITDAEDTADATINGTGQIDGIVYTRGEFRVNGGGDSLTVNGGVWAGEEVRLNGSVNITYNKDYMDAVENLNSFQPQAQIISWRDKHSPYTLSN